MTTQTYTGWLNLAPYGEADDILFLSTIEGPLAAELEEVIQGRNVTVRYWITDKEATKEQAQTDFLKQLAGVAECDFGARYSEITGYLWTDEKCVIGGHDLIVELSSHVGKWLVLEIDIHEGIEPPKGK